MKFDFVYLGQTVLKYQVPLEIFVGLNEIYEKQKKQLPSASKQIYLNGFIASLIITQIGIR